MENLEIKTNLLFIPSRSNRQTSIQSFEGGRDVHTTLDGGIFRACVWTSSQLGWFCQQIKVIFFLLVLWWTQVKVARVLEEYFRFRFQIEMWNLVWQFKWILQHFREINLFAVWQGFRPCKETDINFMSVHLVETLVRDAFSLGKHNQWKQGGKANFRQKRKLQICPIYTLCYVCWQPSHESIQESAGLEDMVGSQKLYYEDRTCRRVSTKKPQGLIFYFYTCTRRNFK